jgi:predicted Mrr-cat superfamily restriction endonuclease
MWMVRAGKGAEFVDDFIEKGIVAIGWIELGNFDTNVSREKLTELSKIAWPAMITWTIQDVHRLFYLVRVNLFTHCFLTCRDLLVES